MPNETQGLLLASSERSAQHKRPPTKEKNGFRLICLRAMHSSEAGNNSTSFPKMWFCKILMGTVGIFISSSRNISQNINRMKQQLGCPFFMEIIIIMSWSIWTTRNDWMFREVDPTMQNCKRKFVEDFSLLKYRMKDDHLQAMETWLQNI